MSKDTNSDSRERRLAEFKQYNLLEPMLDPRGLSRLTQPAIVSKKRDKIKVVFTLWLPIAVFLAAIVLGYIGVVWLRISPLLAFTISTSAGVLSSKLAFSYSLSFHHFTIKAAMPMVALAIIVDLLSFFIFSPFGAMLLSELLGPIEPPFNGLFIGLGGAVSGIANHAGFANLQEGIRTRSRDKNYHHYDITPEYTDKVLRKWDDPGTVKMLCMAASLMLSKIPPLKGEDKEYGLAWVNATETDKWANYCIRAVAQPFEKQVSSWDAEQIFDWFDALGIDPLVWIDYPAASKMQIVSMIRKWIRAPYELLGAPYSEYSRCLLKKTYEEWCSENRQVSENS